MNKINFLLFGLIVILSITACKKDETPVKELGVVINELMPTNSNVVADQNGEFDDWIEMYNLSDKDVDISGYYLTDSKKDLTKWKFPENTIILSDSFLIVWADGDTLQVGLHANFKLSSLGERILFSSPEIAIIDSISFFKVPPGQPTFARIPNGTGGFSWGTPTFNSRNIRNK